MAEMNPALAALRARMKEINLIKRTAALLEWDMQVNMPPGGTEARGEQMGLLARLGHDMLTASETADMLAKAEADLPNMAPDSHEASMLASFRRSYDHAAKIPSSLMEEFAKETSVGQEAWARARKANDFKQFQPYLSRNFELVREMAGHLGYVDEIYDPMLDIYERGAKTAEVAKVFDGLRPHLVELTRQIAETGLDFAPKPGNYPKSAQNAVTLKLAAAIGYDTNCGRQDVAPHPFCTSFSSGDVRITTRFDEARLEAGLYATLHETGHALYEQGLPKEWEDTVYGDAASMAVHESQSRMWENLVGRGRAFCGFALPILKEAFPDSLGGISAEQFYKQVNESRPSFIRVEADEVTYNLHIMLRFDLERALLKGDLDVKDLPEAWNSKMQEYFGITPPKDALGVLQDVHWSAGLVGYFPTYALGNLVSAQLWAAVNREIPNLEEQFAAGRFSELLDWLRDRIHRHGSRYTPDQLLRMATGESLNPEHYVRYIQTKYRDIYGIT